MGVFDKVINRIFGSKNTNQDTPEEIMTEDSFFVDDNITDNGSIYELQKKLYQYVVIFDEISLDIEELKDFCKLTVEYCKLTRHAKCELKTPEIKFEKMKNDTDREHTNGNYNSQDNIITIDEDFLDNVSKNKIKFTELINVIGHEMMHYHQNSTVIEYYNLSIEQQNLVDEKAKASIDSYKNYFRLSEDDVQTLHDLLAPYLKEGEIPKGYDKIEDFYFDVSYASYYTILSEKEARTEGTDFALDFCKKMSDYNDKLTKEKNKIGSVIWAIDTSHIRQEKENNAKTYDEYKNRIDRLSELYNINDEKILKIVESVEAENGSLNYLDFKIYQFALRVLIKNKTTEQRESLLKNAIFNGYNRFADVIIESMQKDVNFKANKNHISAFVSDCLTGKAYGNLELNFPYKSYFTDYSKILNQKDFEEVVKKTLEKYPNNARRFFFFYRAETKTFSLESLLECQKIIFKDKSNADMFNVGIDFLDNLFFCINIEEKIKYLKSGQLEPEVIEILLERIKYDSHFELFKDEIESLGYSISTTNNLFVDDSPQKNMDNGLEY